MGRSGSWITPSAPRPEERAAPTGTIGAPLEQLDLATVIKVSQNVSAEMVLEKLLDTLMRTAIEHAGAERALLMLSRQAGQRIVAEATTSSDTVSVQLIDEPVTASCAGDDCPLCAADAGERHSR